jgi:hypothetical protein
MLGRGEVCAVELHPLSGLVGKVEAAGWASSVVFES